MLIRLSTQFFFYFNQHQSLNVCFMFDAPEPIRYHITSSSGIGLIFNGTYMMMFIYTSSTAQGGGGSFKNRKPIGEIGCCESGMAKRSH